ncbi:MAG: PadR family transcriptional regulator [Clostridiales bacterium]|nr:PadR family transcriptional regulator [Clostridiales bacterium]
MKPEDNLKKGSLEMLVLQLLSNHDCYGYQLTQIMKKQSEDVIIVPSGFLYPTLYKLLEKSYISEYPVKSGKRQERIYYHLQAAGVVYLKNQLDAYHNVTNTIEKILNYTGDGETISLDQAYEKKILTSVELA